MPKTRKPRILIRWDRNRHLQILKMLAWVVFDREHIRNAAKLEGRVASMFPAVVKSITGEQGVTYQGVKDQTLAEQGAPITAGKLLARADKTERYVEWNDYAHPVEVAYVHLMTGGPYRAAGYPPTAAGALGGRRALVAPRPVGRPGEDGREQIAEDGPQQVPEDGPQQVPEDGREHVPEDRPEETSAVFRTGDVRNSFTTLKPVA